MGGVFLVVWYTISTMQKDDTLSLKATIGVTLAVFGSCLLLLWVGNASGMLGELDGIVAWFAQQREPTRDESTRIARVEVFESEYDFEAYYAQRDREEAADSLLDANKPAPAKTSKRKRNPRAPEPPPGITSGAQAKKRSTIEIVYISDSPADAHERGDIGRRAPGALVAKTKYWPMTARISQTARSVPSSLSTYQEVAQYIARHEHHTVQRVKAINDFIGLRLQYDYDSLRPGARKSQTPKAAFDSGLAVCEGYSRLFKAMADEIAIEAVYITGIVRRWRNGSIEDTGHAWNAVKIDGQWHLVDVTWGDNDDNAPYDTSYLFVPPEALGLTHLPTQARWQLREQPMTRSQFVRAPHLRPAFYAEGLDLQSPTTGEVTVTGDAVIELHNPAGRRVHAAVRPYGGGSGASTRCDVQGDQHLRVVCPTTPGRHTVVLFAGRPGKFVAALHVRRR